MKVLLPERMGCRPPITSAADPPSHRPPNIDVSCFKCFSGRASVPAAVGAMRYRRTPMRSARAMKNEATNAPDTEGRAPMADDCQVGGSGRRIEAMSRGMLKGEERRCSP